MSECNAMRCIYGSLGLCDRAGHTRCRAAQSNRTLHYLQLRLIRTCASILSYRMTEDRIATDSVSLTTYP